MLRLFLLAFAGLLFAQPPSATEPFWLQLTSISDAWLPGGSIVHLPESRGCSQLQVRLKRARYDRAKTPSLDLSLNGKYLHFSKLVDGEGLLLDAQTRESLGFLPGDENVIETSDIGRSLQSSWRIQRWNKGYIQAQAVGTGEHSSPIDISLELPMGGVLVVGDSSAKIRIKGELRGGGPDVQLEVNDVVVPARPDAPGYHFDKEVSVQAGARDLELKALDQAGDVTVLALRIIH